MSPTKSLFQEPPDEFQPDADRTEPVVWIRRLVIVERREPRIEPIRQVPFRRGLNIVATEQPRPDETSPVGHNVGKTLLTRLIRYCLGEQHFANDSVRRALARVLPDAYVLAEIVVNGTCWIVARPIGETRSTDAWAIQSDDWRILLGDVQSVEKFPRFVEILEQATVAHFADMTLPHQDRPVRWHDVLAWLTRDQYCRYRNPLEWRSAHTESGTADLHPEDASLLIRAIMDLLGTEEKSLVARHRELLRDKAAKSAEAKRLEDELAKTRQFLRQRLKMDDAMLADDMFSSAAKQQARQMQQRLQADLDGLADQLGLADIEQQFRDAENAVTRKDQELNTRRADRQIVEGALKSSQTASNEDLVASFGDLANPCPLPADQCPLKDPDLKPGERNPVREFVVKEKAAELQRLDQQIAKLNDQLAPLKAGCRALRQKYEQRKQEFETKRSPIGRELLRVNALIEESDGFSNSLREFQRVTKQLAALERQIEESREAHHTAQARVERNQRMLNAHFNRVLSTLVGVQSQGRISIDMRGIHLAVDSQDATPGEALATSATVHSLDLACLSASIAGLGFMPRFLIHDSPREGDLELHIYRRLFDFIFLLESPFATREPSFQYIVTTTTPPAREIDRPPYLCLRLHARDNAGLLLGRRF